MLKFTFVLQYFFILFFHSIEAMSSLLSSGTTPVRMPLEVPASSLAKYEQFYLSNKMAVTLVSLPDSEKAAAAMAIKCGAADDVMPGLAHFTEHAVFLGSKKYPVENAFKTFLNKNGGSSNGGTSMESTTFQFEVNKDALEPVVDIWSQFFKEPLFTEDAIAREIKAVDAEDSKNRIIDGRRILQLMKDFVVPDSSYKKFSTGNLRTLADGDAEGNRERVTRLMRAFHDKHYKANNMALSIVGPQSLEELKHLAIANFDFQAAHEEAVEDDAVAAVIAAATLTAATTSDAAKHKGFPFKQEILGTVNRVKPVRDVRDLSVLFGVPPTRDLFRASPCRLIGNLIAHKGRGSIFALLQDKGWATSTSAGVRAEFKSEFSIFEFSVALTPAGLEHWEEILAIFYQHLSLITSASDETLLRTWREIQAISSLDFQFQEKTTAYELAPFIARQMVQYPLECVLSEGWLLDDVDLGSVRRFLGEIKASLGVVVLRSKDFGWIPDDSMSLSTPQEHDETIGNGHNKVEEWYGVPYHSTRVALSTMEKWHAAALVQDTETTLPEPNDFIAYELADKKIDYASKERKLRSSPPTKVFACEDALANGKAREEVWHSKDEVFLQPRSVINILIRSAGGADNHPVNSLISSLYGQHTARKYYASSLAGLSLSTAVGTRGMGFSFSGFSPRLGELARAAFREFTDVSFWRSIDPSLFEVVKERLLRSQRSWRKERPDQLCDVFATYLLSEQARLPEERIRQTEEATFAMLVERIEAVLSNRSRSLVYTHGDHDSAFALSVNDILSTHLIVPPLGVDNLREMQANMGYGESDPTNRARLLPQNEHIAVALETLNAEDENSALITHFQYASMSPKTSAVLLLMRRLLAEPMFNELRTKQQLGYIVSLAIGSFGRGKSSMRGLTARVLSNKKDPLYMQTALANFFIAQKQFIDTLTQQEVSARAEAIRKSLEDPPTSYTEESEAFYSAIVDDLPFNWDKLVIEELQVLTVEEVQRFFADFILGASSVRRSISVMIAAQQHVPAMQANLAAAGGSDDVSFFVNTKLISSVEELQEYRQSLEYILVEAAEESC